MRLDFLSLFFDGGFSFRDLASPAPRRENSPRFTWRTPFSARFEGTHVGELERQNEPRKFPSLRYRAYRDPYNGFIIIRIYSWVGCHPHIYPQQPCVLFIAHRVDVLGLASPMGFPALICT